MDGIKEESVGNLFNLQVEVQQNPIVEEAGDGGEPGPATGRQAPPAARPGRPAGRHAQTGGNAAANGGTGQPGQPQDGTPEVIAPGLSRPKRPSRLSYSAPSEDVGGQVQRSEAAGDGAYAKVGRNAPCPCGSGKKFKVCHGDPRNRAEG
jgi:preprotein translocase subunit SecA